MSVSAELVRLGLRLIGKRGQAQDPDIEVLRRRMLALERITPGPPRGTQVTRVNAGGVKAVRIATDRSRSDCHILYLHGGGYVFGSPSQYRDFIWRIASVAAAQVLCLSYRLAPEHPFPAALDDAINAYRWLIGQGAAPASMAVMGDSAGGGLTFSSLLRLRDEGVPLPAAAVALSPWTDLAMTGESLRMNAGRDPSLVPERAQSFARHYVGSADPRHPHVSPLYGNPAGLPPCLIHVGSDEILRDDSVRMAEKLRAGGCSVELEIWPRMPHAWHLFARVLPEARLAIARIGEFLRQQMPN
jgi:epsilon-lactone hydrolase